MKDGCLFIVKFSFVWDKICEVFDGIIMYNFHESYKFGSGRLVVSRCI